VEEQVRLSTLISKSQLKRERNKSGNWRVKLRNCKLWKGTSKLKMNS
jgi:hypothetical protein